MLPFPFKMRSLCNGCTGSSSEWRRRRYISGTGEVHKELRRILHARPVSASSRGQFLKAPQRLARQMKSLSRLPSICQKAVVWVTCVRWLMQNLKQNSSKSWATNRKTRSSLCARVKHESAQCLWLHRINRRSFTDLGIVAHGGRQQGEGVLNRDSPLDNVLAKSFQAVLAVRRGQIQQPWGTHANTTHEHDTLTLVVDVACAWPMASSGGSSTLSV